MMLYGVQHKQLEGLLNIVMIAAVDTGGTKTLIALFDRGGRLVMSRRFPTPRTPSLYCRQVIDTVRAMAGRASLQALVVGLPGLVQNGVAIRCPNLGWHNFDIGAAIRPAIGTLPLLVENDANLGGLGEFRRLDHPPARGLYLTISTGIGSGVINHGRIDPHLATSEAGHMVLEYHGRPQQWEAFAAGSAIRTRFGRPARDITDPRLWAAVADRISRGLLALIPVIQPHALVIGGSIGSFADHYYHTLSAILQQQLPDHIRQPTLITPHYPEEAVVYGCFYHAIDNLAII